MASSLLDIFEPAPHAIPLPDDKNKGTQPSNSGNQWKTADMQERNCAS